MTNPNKIIKNILSDKVSPNSTQISDGLYSTECYLCGKDVTYPTLRHGRELCSKCAQTADGVEKRESR